MSIFRKSGDDDTPERSTSERWRSPAEAAPGKTPTADAFRREGPPMTAAERVAARAAARAAERARQRSSTETPAPRVNTATASRADLLRKAGPTPDDVRNAMAAKRQAATRRTAVKKATEHPLLKPVEPDAPGAPPQRGSISAERRELVAYHVDVADKIRKILAPETPIDHPIDRSEELEAEVRRLAKGFMHRTAPPHGADKRAQLQPIADEVFGYGPIQQLIDDPDITEVMVNGPFIVFIEVSGKLVESGYKFADDDHVERIIKRIVLPLGRQVSYHAPLIDARLPDGSRVNATIRPCAIDGPNITIRKFSQEKYGMDDLIRFGSITEEMRYFMEALVVSRQNVIVSGGTGSGKTTLINALSAFIPGDERVVTIEDAAELQLKQRNVVRLETKKPAPDSPSEVTIRDCVVNSLRMRPERIVVGECRAGEALDMLQAMNTGHDGSMTTVHANDPRAAISRLETLCLMSGVDLPILVVRRQIVSAIHFIVQASRLRDGTRKVTHITQVERMEGDVPILSDIFRFVQVDNKRTGDVEGYHTATGNRPTCEGLLAKAGYTFKNDFFTQTRPPD